MQSITRSSFHRSMGKKIIVTSELGRSFCRHYLRMILPPDVAYPKWNVNAQWVSPK